MLSTSHLFVKQNNLHFKKDLMANIITTQIQFDVNCSIVQELNILAEDVTEKDLVEGLASGEYLTTINTSNDAFSPASCVVKFDDTGNEVIIANIVSQTVCDDSEYNNFKIVKSQTSEHE